MLKQQKMILEGASGNIILFKKELVKALDWVNTNEEAVLRNWVETHFNLSHQLIFNSVFPLPKASLTNEKKVNSLFSF